VILLLEICYVLQLIIYKLAVWVGDLGWDMGCRSKRLASVLESPKKHTFIGKTTS